jgi:putative hydrolase of the HAD superfamily
MFDLIAFDADDTLWHNERNYRAGRERFRQLLAPYEQNGQLDGQIDLTVDKYEVANIPYFGYGATGFVFSLIEAAVDLTGGEISGEDIKSLVRLAKEMATVPIHLFDHVQETVAHLAQSYSLMLITKGDLLHQESKVARSGLAEYFDHVRVVSDKTPKVYARILAEHRVQPGRFLMVGNSLRSDIAPVLEIGGWAVYVPSEIIWTHEETEPPTDAGRRFIELEHLGRLPELVEKLINSG